MSRRRTLLTSDDPFNGYEYVDMGLPSKIVWYKNNLGQQIDTIYGTGSSYRIQFGDITDKTNVTTDWTNYKYGTSSNNLSKYNDTDGLISLEPSDDAVNMIMGGTWFTPSPNDCQELIYNSDITFSGNNPTIITFTSRINNNQLKFIAGGVKMGNSPTYVARGYYLTNCIDSRDKSMARILILNTNSKKYAVNYMDRCYGYYVKPINTYFQQ